ncbi:MAG TPA: ANTAR domain-containing protein [Gaiellaceae bacterium]|nr:ANTAR domain-containing protein [Gaiellaceae bacterium]
MPSTDDVHEIRPLRVLIANERQDRLVNVKRIVETLGHEVITPQIEVEDVGEFTRVERPDVALVGLGESTQHALDLIERIVYEAVCPVVTLLHLPDKEFVVEAARRGVFAYATDDEPAEDWQNAIEIALRRFAQLHDLESAFAKRAITERAKGILIERHAISEFQALQMVRDRAKLDGGTLVEAAQAIIDGPVPELAPGS